MFLFCTILQGGFAKCYELTDMETKEILAGKIISKTMLTKPHQKEKVSGKNALKLDRTSCRASVFRRFDVSLIVEFLIYVDVYGDCHPSFSGFQIRNTQAHRWVSWVLRGRRIFVYPVGIVQTEGKLL